MDRKFTIPGKCLMSNNCRFISKLGLHGHKRRIVMEEFLPEPGRAKYWAFLPGSMESLTWLSEGWSITPCRCKGDGQHLCLSTLTPT